MCHRIISHYLPCAHKRCTNIQICSRAAGTPGLDPFDCEAGGNVFLDEPERKPCPICQKVLGDIIDRAGDESDAVDESGVRGEMGGWESIVWRNVSGEILGDGVGDDGGGDGMGL